METPEQRPEARADLVAGRRERLQTEVQAPKGLPQQRRGCPARLAEEAARLLLEEVLEAPAVLLDVAPEAQVVVSGMPATAGTDLLAVSGSSCTTPSAVEW